MTPRLLAAAAFLAAAVALAGCGSGEKLYDVSGTVTFGGKPVPKGLIFFDPDVTEGGAGGQGFANIVDGKFDTADQGKGVRDGPFVIRINGYDGKEAPEAPFGQALFPEYEIKKELPQSNSVLLIEVPRPKKGKP